MEGQAIIVRHALPLLTKHLENKMDPLVHVNKGIMILQNLYVLVIIIFIKNNGHGIKCDKFG